MTTLDPPLPALTKGRFAGIEAYSDEALFQATGVRIAFTTRAGGMSTGAYDSLNLGSQVQDDLRLVQQNRRLLCEALVATADMQLIVPKQVHGDTVLELNSACDVEKITYAAEKGADALLISAPQVAACLCFADCCPLIFVSPTGRFAVVHAGWRGVENFISAKTLRMLATADAQALCPAGKEPSATAVKQAAECVNVYIGAYIHAECFKVEPDVHQRFVQAFGSACAFDKTHIDLGFALREQLIEVGVREQRIFDVDACTVCRNQEFFSFRAQEGIAGRHGAFACRLA